MILMTRKWAFKKTLRKFTELAGLYYAAIFAERQTNGRGSVLILPTGHGYDMVIAPKIRTHDPKTVIRHGERFVEVKGDKRKYPSDIHVSRTMEKLPKEIFPTKFYIYIVYNVRRKQRPGIVILDPHYLKKLANISQHKVTFDVLAVHRHAKKGVIKNYREAFASIDSNMNKVIFRCFENGKIVMHGAMPKVPPLLISEIERIQQGFELPIRDKLVEIENVNLRSTSKQARYKFIKKELLSYLRNHKSLRISNFIELKKSQGIIKIKGSQEDWSTYRIVYDNKTISYSVLWHDIQDAILTFGFRKSRPGLYRRR